MFFKKRQLRLVVAMIIMVGLLLGTASTAGASPNANYFEVTFSSNAPQGGHVGSSNGPATQKRSIRYNNIATDFNVNAYFSGYVFLGWYSSSTGNCTKVTSANVRNYANKTVYAHWAKAPSAVNSGSNGGTFSRYISGTNGHTWTAITTTGNQGAAPVVSVSGITNGGGPSLIVQNNFTVTVRARTDNSSATWNVTRYFRDNYGNTLQMVVTQTMNYGNVRSRVNSTIQTATKFENLVNPRTNVEPLNYNMGYARWFQSPDRDNPDHLWGCCTDSAMMDLLNRRLAADGLLKSNYYFDIRDVLVGISCKYKDPNWRYNASNVEVCYKGEDLIFRTAGKAFLDGWNTELSYDSSVRTSSTFTNNYGSAYGPKSYLVQFTYKNGKDGENSDWTGLRDEIANLLATHPEGVYINSYAGGSHAVLIVGYDSVNKTFTYVDNGAGNGSLSFNETCFHGEKHNYSSEEDFIKKIFTIAYVQ